MNKSSTHAGQLSRQTVTNWIHSLLPDVPAALRIEELGKGTHYCRILNHYFPGTILLNRILHHPKSEYENTINLRILQNAMAQLKIHVPIDPIRLSREKLSDNWTFVTALFRYLTHTHEELHQFHAQKDEKILYGYCPPMGQSHSQAMYTPKRSLEQVYP
jgi:hypothetical protein